MKVVIKSNLSDPGVTQEIYFNDKDIHKLSIKKGSREENKRIKEGRYKTNYNGKSMV